MAFTPLLTHLCSLHFVEKLKPPPWLWELTV